MGNNYFEDHPSYQYDENILFRNSFIHKYNNDLAPYLNQIKNGNILEIGTGIGNFTYYCYNIGVKSYTGIDIDDYFFTQHRKEFKNFHFIKSSFQSFLNGTKKFDIIFTSHLFEHLNANERIELIQTINGGLNIGGIWINYMPNANDILTLGFGAFGDITHYRIYNPVAFDQVINQSRTNFNKIIHLNTKIGYNYPKRILHNIFLLLTKIYFLGMGRAFPKIYTWEFISILKK